MRSDLLAAELTRKEIEERESKEAALWYLRHARDLQPDPLERQERDAHRALGKPNRVLYTRHDLRERVDEDQPTWRIRGGHYLKPKIATKDLSQLDLSAEAAKNIDLSRDGVTKALRRAVNGLPRNLVLGLRSAVLRERHVLKARRRELLGDIDETELGASETQALSALEQALVSEYGFLPRFQLRWIGMV